MVLPGCNRGVSGVLLGSYRRDAAGIYKEVVGLVQDFTGVSYWCYRDVTELKSAR